MANTHIVELTREEMLAAMMASDSTFNGRFITGVLSTGIYCLPSCRARKPKPENVRFFASGAEAAAFGLRPCKKCRPEEFERGENLEQAMLAALIQSMRRDPSAFGSVSDLANRLGVGSTKLFEMCRTYYHSSPGELLMSARVEGAKRKLLEETAGVAEIAYDVGFESLSVFNENFKRRTGLTPRAYRRLPQERSFEIEFPVGFHVGSLQATLGRDAGSVTERVSGGRVQMVAGAALLDVEIEGQAARVSVLKGDTTSAAETFGRVVGISQAPEDFEDQAVKGGFERLVRGRRGARILQTIDFWDALMWVVIGQQINLPFAFKLRRRLFENYGEPMGDGLFSAPRPERVAELSPEDLLPLQFSRRKAEYLIGLAQKGQSWMDSFAGRSVVESAGELREVKGLGPWSINYLMMRAMGFMDCVPYGDTGLQSGLRQLYDLEGKIDKDETDRLLEPFAPYRSLATFHLWQSLKGQPL